VGFEPSCLGEAIRDTLVVSHPIAGEYLMPLVGRCVPPKPQGPINVSEVNTGVGQTDGGCSLLLGLAPRKWWRVPARTAPPPYRVCARCCCLLHYFPGVASLGISCSLLPSPAPPQPAPPPWPRDHQGAASVPFRNAFPREAEFTYAVDNPAFVLTRASERLGPKKTTCIGVSFRPDATGQRAGGSTAAAGVGRASVAGTPAGGGSGGGGGGGGGGEAGCPLRTGKLTVSCPRQTASQWVFYLSA
jgi:hypothetical protein